ncbi:MAG TPA: hypothetical protein VFI43_10160 [Nitrosospira sp.]|nr:hypothetical protein [Nitrosospira sp.]
MKHILALRNHGISAILAGLLIAGTASMTHAESGGNTPAASGEKQAPSGWNKTETSGGGWLSSIFGGSAEASAPDKAETSSGWSSPRDGSGTCKHSSAEEEDFVCKLVRIFWGTDRPYGPNRDMDDNVAAGGAGG